MVPDPRWAAVIVNYEAGPALTACVASLLADDSAGGPPEIVVVDNGSSDGSVAELHAAFPEVPVIDPDANLGYGRAANLGIAATRAPVVAVLNPDAEVAAGTAAAVMARFDADDRLAAVGPQLLNPDGTRYPSARSAPSLGDAVGHALLGSIAARQPLHRVVPPARRRSGAPTGRGMDLRRGPVAPSRGARPGRRLGRAVLPLLRGRGPVPAARRRRLDDRLRARRPRDAHGRGQPGPAAGALDLRAPPGGLPVRGEVVARPAPAPASRRRGLPGRARSRRRGRRGGPGAARNRPRPPSNLDRVMAKASKYNRARIRSRVRRPKRRGGSMVWTITTVVIVVVGVLLVTLTYADRQNNADAAPTIGDHWHAFLGYDVCGTWLPERPLVRGPGQRGRGPRRAALPRRRPDAHPPVLERRGGRQGHGRPLPRATAAGPRRTPRSSSGTARSTRTATSAEPGPTAKKAEVQWTVGRFGKTWTGTPRSGNPADYHPKNGDIVAIYLLPKGAKLPEPPTAEQALTNISDLDGAPGLGHRDHDARRVDRHHRHDRPATSSTQATTATTAATP